MFSSRRQQKRGGYEVSDIGIPKPDKDSPKADSCSSKESLGNIDTKPIASWQTNPLQIGFNSLEK